MDTSVLLEKREEIKRRMSERRSGMPAEDYSLTSRLLPWIFTTGAGLVAGLKATQTPRRWLGSLAGAVILPAVLGLAKRKTQPNGWFHRILNTVFPTNHS